MKIETKDDLKILDQKIVDFMIENRQYILERMQECIAVDEKTNRRDLVTELDRENQQYIIKKLNEFLPSASILAEEEQMHLNQVDGYVWIIDPIDGTMNFVKQREDFAVMISLYQDGKPLLGYIYDIMQNALLHGGPGVDAVFLNQTRISSPTDLELKDGLIGLSGPMLVTGAYAAHAIEKESLGARVLGSAGIEFMRVILGKQVGYISRLKPWDFCAGNALATTLNLQLGYIDGSPINMLKSGVVLVATKKTYSAIMNMVE